MPSISVLVERAVRESSFIEHGMVRGLFNLSAVARELLPRIERELMEPVSHASVLMALKRLAPRLRSAAREEFALLRGVGELALRSQLVEFTFRNSDSTRRCQLKLLQAADRQPESFLTVTQGAWEVMVIASAALEPAVTAAYAGEKLLFRLERLAALTIRLTPESVSTPGIYHAVLKQLAWARVNVIDVVSTWTELTILFEDAQVDRAFTLLKRQIIG